MGEQDEYWRIADRESDDSLSLSTGDLILLILVGLGSVYFLFRKLFPSKTAPKRTFVTGTARAGNGSAAAAAADDDNVDSDAPKLTVLYGSQTGTAEEYARRLQAAGRHYKFKSRCIDMEDIEPEDLADEELVVFVVATHGEGEPTDNALNVYEWLADNARGKSVLKGVRFSCFGLGNRTYKHFNAMGRFFDKRAHELGAERAFRYGEGDDEGSLDEDFCAWEKDFWPALIKLYDIDISDVGSLDDQEIEYSFDIRFHGADTPQGKAGLVAPEEKGIESKTVTHVGVVSTNRELHAERSDRSCRHVEIDIGDTSVSYEAGDHVAVYPSNDTHLVDECLALLCGGDDAASALERSTVFQLVPRRKDVKRRLPIYCSVGTALSYYVDLTCAAPVRFIKACGELATDASEAERLKAAGSTSTEASRALYQDLVVRPHRSIVEVLEMFRSVRMPIVKFLELAPPLHPRYYSISSSARVHPRSIHVTAALVSYTTPGGRFTKGVATHHLAAAAPGARVIISVRRSQFKLPAKSSTPIVMVGPGTGLAPFRAFLQDRKATGKASADKMLLYFGCRRPDEDYIYSDELEMLKDEGAVDLRVAFSRVAEDGSKVYVQHLMAQDGEKLAQLLTKGGAAVYVCGDASQMAKDVDAALRTCLVDHAGKTVDQAKDYLQQMADNGRYNQDVW